MTRRRAHGPAAALLVLLVVTSGCAPGPDAQAVAASRLADLETRSGGRIGLSAVDTGTGATLGRRDGERFALCSTAKALLAGAVLRRSEEDPTFLERTVHWSPGTLVRASPVTAGRTATGATVGELAAAAVTRSDNTASNLLHAEIGGTAATTAFVRGLGDPVTRVDHLEPMPDTVAPGDVRDTTTPRRYAHDLRQLTLGAALSATSRARLVTWMRQATTGPDQIRAGVPHGWAVGDKTGRCSGDRTDDVAVIWPPARAPVVLAVFTEPGDRPGPAGTATIAEATRITLSALGLGAR